MHFLRTLFSFLFVRNWYTGELELSRTRLGLFILFLILFGIVTAVIIALQSPVVYSSAL